MKLQFSTRSLFTWTTAVAVACAVGWAAWRMWAEMILIGVVATVLAMVLTGAVIHIVFGLGESIRRVCQTADVV
jgi:hypothetical protein